LLATAEMIALTYNLKKVSVIAGVGTTEYYRKQGYTIENHYMVKYLKEDVVYKSFNDLHLTLPLNIQQYSLETKLGDFIQQDTDKNDTETTNYSESETLSRIAQQVSIQVKSHPVSRFVLQKLYSKKPMNKTKILFLFSHVSKFLCHPVFILTFSLTSLFFLSLNKKKRFGFI
jgi:hypothetical protein